MKKHLLFILLALRAVLSLAHVQVSKPAKLVGQAISNPDSFVYRTAGARALKAYVFRPARDGKKHPAILLFHGGAWQLGEAAWNFDRAREFAAGGMVAIAIEYRLANNGLSPVEGVEDACTAFAWARANAKQLGIDANRVAGYGVSAGGHLVAAAAVLPIINGKKVDKNSRPDALLLYSPALNMGHDPYFVRLMKGHGNPVEYSPSEYITRHLPPTLIIQGELDSIVYATDARTFRDMALKAGAKCTLFVYPGVGHLLTRNIKIQYRDFDSDPADAADAHKREDEFLIRLGYLLKP